MLNFFSRKVGVYFTILLDNFKLFDLLQIELTEKPAVIVVDRPHFGIR
jgi:hypothetical protein